MKPCSYPLPDVENAHKRASPVDSQVLRIKIPFPNPGEGSLPLLKWPGTTYLTELGNAQYIVPYTLDEHLASGLHGAHPAGPQKKQQLLSMDPLAGGQWLPVRPPQPAQGIRQDRAPVLAIVFSAPTHELVVIATIS